MKIGAARLRAQKLIGARAASAVEVVRWLGAVQSQDYPAAAWALAQRTDGATARDVDALFDAGRILRTHVLRPTWHFVLPEDARSLLALTAPRLRLGLSGRYQRLELDERTIARSCEVIVEALSGGRALTRRELGAVVERAGISTAGQRLPHLIMTAELDGLVISGPRAGRDFTYMLFDERVPPAPALSPGDALQKLALAYFRSHGPAQLEDFVWWSGVSLRDARRAVHESRSALACSEHDGNEYWFDAAVGLDDDGVEPVEVAHLLPNFDEYTVAYRDRSAIAPTVAYDPSFFSFGSILANVATIAGRVRGAWRRVLRPGRVNVEISLLDPVGDAGEAALAAAAARYAAFVERPLALSWQSP